MIFEVTSKDVKKANDFFMYVTDQINQDISKTRTQAGNLIKGGMTNVKNYVENTLQLDGNSKNQRDYFDFYLKDVTGLVYQGLQSTVK